LLFFNSKYYYYILYYKHRINSYLDQNHSLTSSNSMKKIILSALLIGGAAVAANAQAHSVLVFGDLGIGSTKDADDNKTFNFRINPGVGYQFDNNWTVGLTGEFSTLRARPKGVRDWRFNNTYRAGVFVRYTLPVSKIFVIFNQLEAGYRGSAQGVSDDNATFNSNGFYARLRPAVGILIKDGFALNFGFGGVDFDSYKYEGATNSTTTWNLTWGTQFNIGVSKNIFCNKMKRHHGSKMNHGSKVDKDDEDNESED
jgi:hypothetical protein